MRNKTLLVFFFILIAFTALAIIFQVYYGKSEDTGMFIVTALTAIGTCGVTILNVFPYEHKDNLEAEICFRKNKEIWLIIHNKTNHKIYLGNDEYPFIDDFQEYGIWWIGNKSDDNINHLKAMPLDNLVISPQNKIYYIIHKNVFGKIPLNEIHIQIITSGGYKFDVKNNLTEI